MHKGDVLLIGPYRYVVEEVRGRFALISWKQGDTVKELWVCTARYAPLVKAA